VLIAPCLAKISQVFYFWNFDILWYFCPMNHNRF
jgi:hypothetical protein